MANRTRRWSIVAGCIEQIFGAESRALTGAEIGVWRAQFTSAILSIVPRLARLYAIDPYRNYAPTQYRCRRAGGWSQEDWDQLYTEVRRNLRRWGSRVVLLRTTSKRAAASVPSGLDFVFIDGNHAYDFVRQDIEMWEAKVRLGGLVCGHDYGSGYHRGVKRAVDEYVTKHNRMLQLDSRDGVWWWRKP